MTTPETDPARSITRTLRWLVRATVVLGIALVGVVIWTFSNSAANTDALCALRADQERQVETSQNFLIEHPKGIPGIPVKTIEQGIANRERTIVALSNLSC